jgi:hypothetical protein
MKKIQYSVWAAILIAPWLLLYIYLPARNIDLTCQSTYEMLKRADGRADARSYGTMTSYYHADGSGISRYAGMLQIETESAKHQKFTVHRVNNFGYELVGSFIKVTSQQSSKYVDDNADDSAVAEYVYPGFKSGSVEYFKIFKVGGKGFAAGIGFMPRIYCEPIKKSVSLTR